MPHKSAQLNKGFGWTICAVRTPEASGLKHGPCCQMYICHAIKPALPLSDATRTASVQSIS